MAWSDVGKAARKDAEMRPKPSAAAVNARQKQRMTAQADKFFKGQGEGSVFSDKDWDRARDLMTDTKARAKAAPGGVADPKPRTGVTGNSALGIPRPDRVKGK